jgi:hypothetical protein
MILRYASMVTLSTFANASTVNPDQKKIDQILTAIESLEKNDPDKIAYEKAIDLQNETMDRLTAEDWKAIDGFHDVATKKEEAFLRSKNIPLVPQSVMDAMNTEEPTDSAIDAYIVAGDVMSQAIEKMSEADLSVYQSFREEADTLQHEYMVAHGVKFVDPALEARLQKLDEKITALWNEMPESYFETFVEDGDHSDAVYAGV